MQLGKVVLSFLLCFLHATMGQTTESSPNQSEIYNWTEVTGLVTTMAPKKEFPVLLESIMYKMKKKHKGVETGVDTGGISQVMTLAQYVTTKYLKKCSLLVVFHSRFKFETNAVNFDVSTMLRDFSFPLAHTEIKRNYKVPQHLIELSGSGCRGYMVFLHDISLLVKIIGSHSLSKVVVITSSSRWKIEEFLESSEAKGIVNLLVIATTGASDIIIRRGEKRRSEKFLNMYTHDLYINGVGNSRSTLLTSWKGNKLSRNVNLFPSKMGSGFNGRQFSVLASVQPPFVLKKNLTLSGYADNSQLWDGIEFRLLHLLSPFLNYTMKIEEAKPVTEAKGPADVVIEGVMDGKAEIGVGGVYRSLDLPRQISFSMAHSIDCATFVTRSSTALPRHRAILGPFHWHVWLGLTITYFLAILPLTFADKHSLMYLWEQPWHIETMFWYVFGTFTNCFTFKGENAWTKTKKNASRLFIGSYWAFTIIITACYTGSIIAFITLYVFPPALNSVEQLIQRDFRVGVLSTGGWGEWFNNSADPKTKWLLRDIELVPSLVQGLKNVTESYFLPLLRPYAFLSSRSEIEYAIITNYTMKSKKDLLHVSKDCFVPFSVAFVYPEDAPYRHKMNEYILRAQQSGLIAKVYKQMQWELQRSATGQRLQASSGAALREILSIDRKLTLDDTQGMFILLGSGFLIALVALLTEISLERKKSKKTWKFWKLTPSLPPAVLNFLTEHAPQLLQKNTNKPPVQDFIYKTFDSRVLNSRYQNVEPIIFFSESRLYPRTSNMLIRTKSLPLFQTDHKEFEGSNSCHQFIQADIKADNANIPIMRFASVGSILSPKICQLALNYEFLIDRPQTSQI